MGERLGVKNYGRILRIPTATGFGVGDINSYVILPEKGDDKLVLIDTGIGSEDAWVTLGKGLAEFGFAIEDIKLLLLTHAHTDHFGQAERIRDASGCAIWGHEDLNMTIGRYSPGPERVEIEREFLARLGFTRELYDRTYAYRPGIKNIMRPCVPDRLLKDGEVVAIPGFDLQLIHTPGHCPEEVVYWQADTRQMFSGDHLLPDITPVCLLHIPATPDGPRTRTLVQYYQSADKIKPYAAKAVYPSHGDVFQDHLALIASYRLSTERRLLKISRILSEHGPLTPVDVGKYLFPKAWEDQMFAVISEVMGHLDMLEDGGHVRVEDKNGMLHYALESVPRPS